MESRTPHQQRIDAFMAKAKQALPLHPVMPSDEIRLLRARLILEEALETINALGFSVNGMGATVTYPAGMDCACISNAKLVLEDNLPPNLVEIVDGCADISVVTIGTLSACGVADEPILTAVDENNLAKFGPGHLIREDGKLVKPPGHKPPNIQALLDAQAAV